MKLITRDTDYAIRAISCIAGEKEKVVTVKALSGKLDMPRAYLRKILQTLSSKGLLRSSKGRGGGFTLVASPEEITVFSIVEIFQGPFRLNEHVFKGKVCPRIKTCYLKKKLDATERSMIKDLRAITIASIMKGDG